MALIYCPDCGKEISDRSLYCVHCGCPANYYDKSRKVIKEEKRKETIKPDIPVRRFDKDGLYLPIMKTMKQASEMTGLSYTEIRKLVFENRIVYVKAGNKVLINMDSLACYLSGDEYQMESVKKLYDDLNEEVEKIWKG